MSSIYVQVIVVFGVIFACLVAIMFCSWKAMDALDRKSEGRES